jgi:hypothetical protein
MMLLTESLTWEKNFFIKMMLFCKKKSLKNKLYWLQNNNKLTPQLTD